jgi:hypothetical protein
LKPGRLLPDRDFEPPPSAWLSWVGRVRTCTIEPRALSQAEQWISARRIEWEHRLDRLGEYLKSLENEGDGNGSGE